MTVSSDGDSGARVATRVLASVPWVVVLLGVLTLVVIMVVALSSFRGPERAPVSSAPPPLVLPTPLEPTAASAATGRPTPTSVRSTRSTAARSTRAARPPADLPGPAPPRRRRCCSPPVPRTAAR